MHVLAYHPTPIQELHSAEFDRAGIRVLIKREDLNHPLVSGNKWWKLKYNLQEAQRTGKGRLLTFGGAFSNHIFATAAAARELGLQSIGIIRGEECHPLNPVLTFARQCGMALHYISRADYRKKQEPEFIHRLHQQLGDFYLIPEGGTNALAVQGVAEFVATLATDFDVLCCAVGTGGTLAGLVNGLQGNKQIMGFAVLKAAASLENTVRQYLVKPFQNWCINHNWHHGGYAKVPAELRLFIQSFQQAHGFLPDGVYMGKLLRGITLEIAMGTFKRGTTVLVLHSGGIA
jgi:1-aminocyclopropane-1-carboxylate deaminase